MAITSIGNRLKEYQNSPVLQRSVFRNRSMDAADARAPLGVLASSPELINAVVQNQMPSPVINTGFMGFDQQPDASAVDSNAGKRGDRKRRREETVTTDSTVENPVVKPPKMSEPRRKPAETATQPLPKSKSDTAPKPKKSTKSKSDKIGRAHV